jgi:hypothetical protein
MQLTLSHLKAGVGWWLNEKSKNKWPPDFHNADYYEIYEIRKHGLTHGWWRSWIMKLQTCSVMIFFGVA